jgi:hypothetical protein
MPTNLSGVLQLLAGPGAVALVMFLVSRYAERWPWYQKLSATAKQDAMLILSLVVAGLAYAGLMYYRTLPPEVQAQTNDVFVMLLTVVSAVLAPSVWHSAVNRYLKN